MCFSATASFTAAAVAGSIGIVTLWKAAKLRDPALLPIAAFPVLFADQQFVEGLLWLDLARPEPGPCRPLLTHAFVAYAEIFWPIFAPLAAWLIEPVQWRRRLIGVCVLVGAAVSTYLLWKMLGSPYTASAATGHIVYSNDVAYPKGIEIPYVVATTISLLLSSHRLIQLLAIVILGAFAVAYWSYHQSYISVWCFFAAIASIIVYLFVHRAGAVRPRQPTGEHVMIRTPFCDVMEIDHPIALGGMGSVYSPDLVAAVSNAGGLGAMGCHQLNAEQIRAGTAALRERTNKPFGLNFLLFDVVEERFAAALALRPKVMAFAWPRPEQDLKSYVGRAHDAGCKVTFMANGVPEAVKAAEAGADVIIAQGTEGGGHVGWVASMVLTPMVVDAVAPIPVLTAGGVADGRGLAAAIALGADGVLLGTRFLATVESPLHQNFKQAIVDSDGHDTALSEIPDIAAGKVWPGAMSRSRRNRFIERWAGREWLLRSQQAEALAAIQAARKAGDVDEAPLSMGQDAGLINDIPSAGELVQRIAEEAAAILSQRLPKVMRN